MLFAYDRASRKLVEGSATAATPWLHVVSPTDEEMGSLRGRVPASFLPHLSDVDELARVDRDGDARLVIVRVPRKHGALSAVPYTASMMAIVVSEGSIVTISPYPNEVAEAVLAREDFDVDSPQRFVLHVVLCAAERFLAHLREVNRDIDALEDELQTSIRNHDVYSLLKFQKSLVHFSTALSSNALMLDRLKKDAAFEIAGNDLDLYEDVEVELRQADEMTAISRNILGEMMDAFASMISNNLNAVMKVLTSITIVLMFPMLIASFFGMNVGLPLQQHPSAFVLLLVLSVAVAATIAAIFFRKRWL